MHTIIVVNLSTQKAYSVGCYQSPEYAMGDFDHIVNVIGNDPHRAVGITEVLSVEEYFAADHRTIEEAVMSWVS